jgi:hypothetical protein
MSTDLRTSLQMQYFREPTPHLYIPEVLPPSVFEQLKFPVAPKTPKGRTGNDIYRGDAQWDHEVAKPGWKELAGLVSSAEFVGRAISYFAEDMLRFNCVVDPDKAYVTDYVESWEEVVKSSLATDADPNALFVRFDFQTSDKTYVKPLHCDWRRRLVGGMLFISDAVEQGMEGGDFAFFTDMEFQNDRTCHKPAVAKVFPFRKNQGVLFLNSNTGFHGPLPIQKMSGMRQWIYYAISSRQDIWPTS